MNEHLKKLTGRLSRTTARAVDASLAMVWLSTYGVLFLAALFFLMVFGSAVAVILVVLIPALWFFRREMKQTDAHHGLVAKVAGCVMLAAWASNDLFGRMPGLGGLNLEYWVDALTYTSYLTLVFALMSLGRWTKPLLVLFALVMAIAHPVWEMTGPLVTLDNVETMLGSSMDESVGFLLSIPAKDYANPLMLAILVSALVCCTTRPRFRLPAKKARIAWLFAFMGLFVFIKTSPLFDAGKFIVTALCADHRGAPMTWKATGTVEGRGTEQNFIIVMGESMRFDALGIYGNPYDTTPFLASIPHKMIERPVSPSGATMAAVPRELAVTTGKARMDIQPQNNVVALARSLGMETYWLSSQKRETNQALAISAVAESAETHFYATGNDDFAVVNEFEKVLDKDANGRKRFFVIHTYGAHEPACMRVEDFGRPFKTGVKGKDWAVPLLANEGFIDCYLAAAKKADTILAMIARALEKRGQTYSVLFTSDHGTSFFFKDEDFKCCRFPDYRELFEVPLVEFGTNTKETLRVNAIRETNRISDYVPTWIGVTTNLTEPGYDIFHPGSDEPYTRGENSELRRYRDLKSSSFKDVLSHGKGKEEP